jgi:hypothetical protein
MPDDASHFYSINNVNLGKSIEVEIFSTKTTMKSLFSSKFGLFMLLLPQQPLCLLMTGLTLFSLFSKVKL